MEFGLVALWIAVFLLLGLLALPLALAVIGVVAHLVGQIAFPWPAIGAGLLVLAGGSAAVATRVEPDYRRYGEAAVVFVLAFLLVVFIRAFDPAAAPLPVAVGEKFLDFGMLKTLERSHVLPPEDMWFAGESVRYYYGGSLLTVLLGTLTQTGARYAYNLALAGFFATLVTTAYGLAGSLAEPAGVPRRLAAGLAAFFVGIAGNLATATKVLVWLLPNFVAGWVATLSGLPGDVMRWTPTAFGYFDASRVIPTDPSVADPYMAATEFPLFAWMNGDLHAHMMSQPFTLFAAALLLAYWRLPAERRRRRLLLLFGVLPPVAGFVGFTNLWSFPTVGGLTVLAVAFAPAAPSTLLPAGYRDRLTDGDDWLVNELQRVGLALGAAIVVLLLGIVWTAPFWFDVVFAGPGRTVGLWNARTPLGNLLVVNGAFLAIFAVALSRRVGAELGRPLKVLGGFLATVLVAVVFGFPALGLAVPLIIAGWWLCRTRDADFALVLVVAGAGLLLIVELVTIEGERFNVIFKPYSQIWLFWATAGGVYLARLVDGWPADKLDAARPRLAFNGRVLATILLVSTALWAGFALPSNVSNAGPGVQAEGPTLDATAYLDDSFPREAPAIRWLDARDGQPTIVTSVEADYWWRPDEGDGAAAPASLTGLPTVLGWYHEKQYRGEETYRTRLTHVNDIYTSTDHAYQRELLDYYDVGYVYVGPAERATYGEITVGEIEGVTVARQFEAVTIYRVQ